MSILGNSTTPTFGYDQFMATANQAAQLYTMPAGGGLITDVTFYGSGNGASSNTAYGCIWDSSGNLLAQGSGVVTTGGATGGGNQAWHTDTLTTPLFVAGGISIYIGWQRSTATTFDWSWANDGAAVAYRTAGNTPSNFGTTVTVQNGSIGAYATYTPGGGKLNTGTSGSPVWTPTTGKVNTGTPGSPVWTVAVGKLNTGTPGSPVWTPTS